MGYYIEGPTLGKTKFIVDNFGAILITPAEALEAIKEKMGVICVVNNGPFEAAAFCYNEDEFEAFNDPGDFRPKKWLLMDMKKAKELTGYKE